MIKYLVEKAGLVFIMLIIILIAGFYAFKKLPVNLFPNLNYPLLNVITHYPGTSPADIETLITRPIENQISSLPYVRRISSVSRQGLSQVTVAFDVKVDVKAAYQMVTQAVSKASPLLPPGVTPTIENIGSSLQAIMLLGVTAQKRDLTDLKTYLKINLLPQLRAVRGVFRIEIIGGGDEAYVVRPSLIDLMKYRLSLPDLSRLIAQNNVQEMAGYITKGHQDYAVRGLGNIQDLVQLKNIVVKNKNGLPIFLKDVAVITHGHLPQRYAVYINGRPGIAISIFKNPGADTVATSSRIRERLKELKKALPEDIKIINIYDQSEIIKEAADNLRSNILVGGLLVVIILFFFLGTLREALLIAMSIPVTVVVSFIFLHLGGFSLNMITIGAMAVAVGMVVDDAIVVLENILRHRKMGKGALEAAISGTKEIMAADISGTLTTIAAFIPFIFLAGLAGRFTAPFGWVMIIMLLTSLIISLSFIPVFLARGKTYKLKRPLATKAISAFITFNQKLLRLCLRHKKAVLLLTFFVFLLSSALLAFSHFTFLPQVDEGAILLEYVLPPGTSFKESNHIGGVLEHIIMQDPAVSAIYRRTGSKAASYQVEPVNRGELVIKLKPKHMRPDIFHIIKRLKTATAHIPGLITLYHQVTAEKMDESLSGLPTVFGMNIYGEDYAKLLLYGQKVEEMAKKIKGINVINNTKYRVPELQIIPIPAQVARYGLNTKEIMDTLRLYLGGNVVSWIIKGKRSLPIFLIGRDKENVSVKDIKHILIKTPTGVYVPLGSLTKIASYYGANAITHINLQRVVTLPIEIEGPVNRIVKQLKRAIKQLNLPQGYFVEFSGQYKLFWQMAKDFFIFALMSILIVYLIMTIQFGNYLHPLAIMFEMPFSFSGAFLAMAISRQPLNLSFFIGLITLIGVSVNNGIILIDYINKRRKAGISREKACEEACKVRTRPILLTALTSILALLPISLGWGSGAKMHQSLAICVIGGLLLNTFLTLNVLPVVYSVMDNLFLRHR